MAEERPVLMFFCVLLLGLVILGGVGGAVVFLSHPHHPPQQYNETRIIGVLRTLGTAQEIYRERDVDGDGQRAYAPGLADLADPDGDPTTDDGLISESIGTGEKGGYVVGWPLEAVHRGDGVGEFGPGPGSESDEGWTIYAVPAVPGETGFRVFRLDHEGTTRFAVTLEEALETDPSTWLRVD